MRGDVQSKMWIQRIWGSSSLGWWVWVGFVGWHKMTRSWVWDHWVERPRPLTSKIIITPTTTHPDPDHNHSQILSHRATPPYIVQRLWGWSHWSVCPISVQPYVSWRVIRRSDRNVDRLASQTEGNGLIGGGLGWLPPRWYLLVSLCQLTEGK